MSSPSLGSLSSSGRLKKYIYDLPYICRKELCRVLDENNQWEALGGIHMQFSSTELSEFGRAVYRGASPTDVLLSSWAAQNHTILELFIILGHCQHYRGMRILSNYVDPKYHCYIRDPDENATMALMELENQQEFRNLETKLTKPIDASPNETARSKVENVSENTTIPASAINDFGTVPRIPYIQLETATNKWDVKNILGKGGFGTVFKGNWQRMDVAIKRMDQKLFQYNLENRLKQSVIEVTHLNSYRHENILAVYGYCWEDPYPCIVSQFMSNGSLEDRLLCKQKSVPLNWILRYQIVKGVACGIQFLHTIGQKPLIHGDIKSANILLDKNFEPKLGDFGLAKELRKTATSAASNVVPAVDVPSVDGVRPSGGTLASAATRASAGAQASAGTRASVGTGASDGTRASNAPKTRQTTEYVRVSRVHGTRAYLPDDYLRSKKLSVKVDVYSFGIMIFEVATGQRALDESRKPKLLREMLEDENIDVHRDLRAGPENLEIYSKLVALGKECAHREGKRRPNMVAAVEAIEEFFSPPASIRKDSGTGSTPGLPLLFEPPSRAPSLMPTGTASSIQRLSPDIRSMSDKRAVSPYMSPSNHQHAFMNQYGPQLHEGIPTKNMPHYPESNSASTRRSPLIFPPAATYQSYTNPVTTSDNNQQSYPHHLYITGTEQPFQLPQFVGYVPQTHLQSPTLQPLARVPAPTSEPFDSVASPSTPVIQEPVREVVPQLTDDYYPNVLDDSFDGSEGFFPLITALGIHNESDEVKSTNESVATASSTKDLESEGSKANIESVVTASGIKVSDTDASKASTK